MYIYSDYYSNVGCDWSMAHEFGHCLGVDDYYTQTHLPGFDKNYNSIMNYPGMHATFYDVVKVVDAFKYDIFQEWYCIGGL